MRSWWSVDGEDQAGAPIGRRAFLGVVGVGLTSLAWGGAAADLLAQSTKLVPESLRAMLPFGKGWRIYAVNPPHPKFDPAVWRLQISGMVERPLSLSHAELLALPRSEQVSDFVCVTGWSVDDVAWSGVRFADLLSRRPAFARRPCAALRVRRGALRRLAVARPGAGTRRDARAWHGRLAVTAQARRTGARGHAADVRLQGRQVGAADRRHRSRRRWLLAAARLRPRCVDRGVEWALRRGGAAPMRPDRVQASVPARPSAHDASRASARPSATSTRSTRSPSS